MNKNKYIYILFVVLLFLTGCTNNTKEDKVFSDTRFMLGTYVTIQILDHGSKELLDEAFNLLISIENSMSTKIESSDISLLNLNAGKKAVQVTNDTAYVLNKALYYGEISNGKFDISIGPLVNLWNIGNGAFEVPKLKDITESLKFIDYTKINIKNNIVSLAPNMSVDLGAIAKGFAADKVSDLLVQNRVNSAIINLGGNIKVLGSKQTGDPYNIGIQNPFDTRNEYLGILSIIDKSVVSSGDYERYFEVDGKRYHHIFDKTTGFPVETDVSSVSVITPLGIDGDALSTIFFSMEVEEGFKLARQLGHISLIYVTKNKEVYLSKNIEENFKLTNQAFSLFIK